MTPPTPSRVLLVDDEPSVLETMAAILEQEGYEVVPSDSVEDALLRLRSAEYDLLLTDLRIDTGSGLTLLAEVRERAPDTTAIMLTGYASLESAVDALREGAYDYLVKPCHVEELKATVARGVERSRLSRTLRERVKELDAANSELNALSKDLQRRVEQATADLVQKLDELATANQRLEDTQRHREEFISMAAHELKTPVTSVRASAQLLRRRFEREGTADLAAIDRGLILIDQQSAKLARLVAQMLDISRIEAGRLGLDRERVDLVQVVRDVIDAEQSKATERTIVLQSPDRLEMLVDPLRMDQVLTNLVDNAIKYSPEGGDVHVAVHRQGKNRVEIVVTDAGPGIPLKHRPHIFERFFRAHEDRHHTGLGLGLYITSQIVVAHSGNIRVEFPNSGGTRFVIDLPLNAPEPGSVLLAVDTPSDPEQELSPSSAGRRRNRA